MLSPLQYHSTSKMLAPKIYNGGGWGGWGEGRGAMVLFELIIAQR